MYSIQVLRPYLLNEEFGTRTDYYALRWLISINDPSWHLIRGRQGCSEHEYSVKYKKGKYNVIEGTISRIPTQRNKSESTEDNLPYFLTEISSIFFINRDLEERDKCLAIEEIPEFEEISKQICIEEILREQVLDDLCRQGKNKWTSTQVLST